MADQKNWRFCNRCEKKHPSPTGKKCKGLYLDMLDLNSGFEKEDLGRPSSAGGPPILSPANRPGEDGPME